MAEFLVEQIEKGERDSIGAEVDTVYAKVAGRYAVYRADGRVVIQWADTATMADPPAEGRLGPKQREALAPLFPLRGEINGLIDGWRSDTPRRGRERENGRAKRFDRQVADALELALAGSVAQALERLTAIRDDIRGERETRGRAQYVIAAFVAALFIAGLSYLLGSLYAHMDIPGCDPLSCSRVAQGAAATACHAAHCWNVAVAQRWLAAGFGAFGAFLSLALAVEHREVRPDLQPINNALDACLRIVVGTMSAVALIALLDAKAIQIGGVPADPLHLNIVIVAAIVAGFTERLVKDALSQFDLSPAARAAATRAQPAAVPPMAPPATGGEGNPGGAAPPPTAPPPRSLGPGPAVDASDPPADDEVDGCVSDHEPDPAEATHDVELPEAAGGVAEESAR